MFKKPIAHLKTFSALRSSDRRRFQNEAWEAFPDLKDQLVMPEDLRSAKFTTNAGTSGILYVTDPNQPLWLSIENLPPVPTDLMIPGLVPDSTGILPQLDQGDLVAITVRGYLYPLAIGTMALPTSEIKPRSGMKGKAVHILHVFQDCLWSMGDKSEPPEIPQDSDIESEAEDQTLSEKEPEIIQQDNTAKEEKPAVQMSTEVTSDNTNVFPVSASSFYSAYVMPSRPIGAEAVDIKRSSWKKLQKFMKAVEKTGLLKTKEQRGELVITSVQWSHPSLEGLSRYKTLEHSTPSGPAPQKEDPKPAEIQELFKPLGALVCRFFDEADQDKGALYTLSELRTIVNDYVKSNSLANPKNQKMIRLNAILCDAVLSKSEYSTVDQLARDQLVARLSSKMQAFHTLLLPGQKEPVLKKGLPKPIEIVQEIRQGRKTVTKVTGIESYNLDIDELVKEFTKLCASSVTTNPVHGVSPKNPLFEIMIQGPQIKNVTEFLLHRGVPKKLIESTDKTQKKKK
ncbi:hypothetical protein BY458DRAFT_489044 [Sporodiniella umbellata]|nr:hypothetical protein BY458DRAFT_489044 [Sporodiniella umbellata]